MLVRGLTLFTTINEGSICADPPTFFSPVQDFASRAKLGVQHLVQKVGFFGILACASVSSTAGERAWLGLAGLAHTCFAPADSQPSVRPGWDNLRPLPGALLDLLWCHFDWESRHQDAHPGGFPGLQESGSHMTQLLLGEHSSSTSGAPELLWGGRGLLRSWNDSDTPGGAPLNSDSSFEMML